MTLQRPMGLLERLAVALHPYGRQGQLTLGRVRDVKLGVDQGLLFTRHETL